MKKTVFIIIVLILIKYSLAGSIIFNETDKGLKVFIRNLEYQISENSQAFYSIFIDHEDSHFPSNHNFFLSDIRFQIAVPEMGFINYKFENYKIKNIGNFNILELSNLDSNYLEASNELDILEPSIKIERIGKLRGLPVALVTIQPFYYNSLSGELGIIDSSDIYIDFPEFIKENREIPKDDLSFFTDVKNKFHTNVFYLPHSLSKAQKLIDELHKSDWYNSGQKYVRLITKTDGITQAKAKDILLFEPTFRALPLTNFILLSEGMEKRMFISDNGNNIFDDDDNIYFYGSRAKGDTTWFENYTDEASYYLTFDESRIGLRYEEAKETVADKIISHVDINRHIEIERKYHRGFPQDNVEIVPGEGWFWEILEPRPGPIKSRKLQTDIEIYPYKSNNDTITIELNYRSSLYDITVDTNRFKFSHLLKIDLNNTFISLDSLKRKEVRTKEVKIASTELIQGLNQILVESVGIKKNDTDFLTDQVGFDFITIKGKSEPILSDPSTPFYIKQLSENMLLDVFGLSNSFVLAIDTLNGQIYQPKTKPGSFISLGTYKETNAISHFKINDTTFTHNEAGFSLGYIESPNFSNVNIRHFQDYSSEIEGYLASIPTQSIVFILFNSFKSNSELPSSLKTVLISLGSKLVSNVNMNDIWGMIVQKGKPETIKEQISTKSQLSFYTFIEHQDGKSYKSQLVLKGGSEHLLYFSDGKKINLSSIEQVNTSDLRNKSNQADLIIITHPDFLETATKLKEHRLRTDSSIKALVIDVNDIYKEFYNGKKSPHGLKEFLRYAYYNWKTPKIKYITLIGDASWDARMVQSSTINRDYIPAYGWPSSDYWYGLLEGDDLLSELVIGRIPIKSNQQGLKYVEKVIDYETVPNDRWMKRFLFMSGGTNDNERASWYSIMKYTFAEDLIMKSPALCADTIIINKKDPKIGGEGEALQIISEINKGADWVAFLGHGSPVVLDMDGWQADKLNNKGRHGFFSTLSCNTSAFAEPDITARNEDYVLAPDRGFVGAGGSSNLADQFVSISLHLKMLQTIANPDNMLLTYPEILNTSRNRLISGELEGFLILQYTYLGDPMIKLRMIGSPDIYLNPNNIKVSTKQGTAQATEDDSLLVITGVIDNIGYKQNKPFRLVLTNQYNNNQDTSISLNYNGICYPSAFKFELRIAGKPGKHQITITADPDRQTDDRNFKNNVITINQEVFSSGLYPLEPQAFWNVNKTNPQFRFINPLAEKFKFSYDFKVFQYESNNQNTLIKNSAEEEITEHEGFIEWNTNISLNPDKQYYLYALNIRKDDTNRSSPLYIPFYVKDEFTKEMVKYKIWGSELEKLENENFQYDSITNELKIKQRDIPIEIIGIRGKEGVLRASEILFDNEYVLTTPPVQRGFNIVTFNESNPSIRKIRWFETWDDVNTITNENSEKLVRFLRDTVSLNEYVAIATCDEAMQVPIEHRRWKEGSIGSIDSLITTLKEFGSILADSLDWGVSFTMLGKKGMQAGEAIEDIDYSGDTARISTFINYISQTGKVIFPQISGFKSIKKININGNFDYPFANSRISLFSKTLMDIDFLLLDTNNVKEIDLVDYKTESLARVQPVIFFDKIERNYLPSITSFEVLMEPSPELFLSDLQTKFQVNNLLRGDTAIFKLSIKNISPRAKSEETKANIYSVSQVILTDTLTIQSLNPDESRTYTINVPTTNLSRSISLSTKINDPHLINEFYIFNNSSDDILKIIEDSEKPTVKLFLDEIEVKSGDYTSKRPEVRAQMFDNSILEVTNPKQFWIRINGTGYNESNSIDYKFQSFGANRGLKAELSFIPDSFDYKQNNINVYLEDATGNRDTLLFKIFVSQNGMLENIVVYPNPSKEFVNFNFYYKSPSQEGAAIIDIFNLNGQKVKTLTYPLKIGTNNISWDLFDEYNNKIPVGAYYTILRIQSDIYVDPQRAILFRTD